MQGIMALAISATVNIGFFASIILGSITLLDPRSPWNPNSGSEKDDAYRITWCAPPPTLVSLARGELGKFAQSTVSLPPFHEFIGVQPIVSKDRLSR